MGVNNVTIVGNVGADPEVRFTQGGLAVCEFSVAVSERVKKGDDWQDHTEWFRVVTFGKNAENAGKLLGKGRQVYVEGSLRQEKYKDKDGAERLSVKVLASRWVILGSRADNPGGDQVSRPANAGKRPAARGAPLRDAGFVDDNLPF